MGSTKRALSESRLSEVGYSPRLLEDFLGHYDPADRVFGRLADPQNPSQPGSSLELQVQGMPQSEFLSGSIIS